MRKFITAFMMIMLLLIAQPAYAESSTYGDPVLKLNEYSFVYAFDSHLYLEKNRLMVPVELVREFMGADINYAGDTITITLSGGELLLNVGSDMAIVNGETTKLDSAVKRNTTNEMPYIPIRVVLDAFGFTATWDNQWKRLEIMDDRLMVSESAEFFKQFDMLGSSGLVNPDYPCGITKVEVKDKGPAEPNSYSVNFYYQNKTGQDIPAGKLDIQYWILEEHSVQTSAGGAKTFNQNRPDLAKGAACFDKVSVYCMEHDGIADIEYIILWPRTLK